MKEQDKNSDRGCRIQHQRRVSRQIGPILIEKRPPVRVRDVRSEPDKCKARVLHDDAGRPVSEKDEQLTVNIRENVKKEKTPFSEPDHPLGIDKLPAL